jgi:CRP-like cAMP-binding protein
MSDSTIPKDQIADGNFLEAVHLADWRLGKTPGDPSCHLDMLAAISRLDPQQISRDFATRLFNYFLATANFPSTLATILYMGASPEDIDDGMVTRFLDIFGSKGEKGSSTKPPKLSRAEDDDQPPLSSIDKNEVITSALKTWEESISKLFMPPPIAGKQVPLFKSMGENSFKILIRKGLIRFIKKGDKIINQGEEDSSFYILFHGVLEVHRENETGIIRLGYLRPGSFFGEMALVTSGPRNATIVAHETSVIIEIKWELLSSMLQNDPDLANELARYTRFRLLKNLMATSPLFRTISPDAKGDIIKSFKPHFPKIGDTIIEEGKSSPGLFLVASGEVEVFSGKGKGKTLLSTLSPGSVFGEISLIREGNATASIKVSDDGVVLMHLARDEFQKLALLYPDLLSHVYQVAIDRSETTKRIKSDVAIPAEDLLL